MHLVGTDQQNTLFYTKGILAIPVTIRGGGRRKKLFYIEIVFSPSIHVGITPKQL